MTWPELAEAIPPAYTEHIGQQLMEHLRRVSRAQQREAGKADALGVTL